MIRLAPSATLTPRRDPAARLRARLRREIEAAVGRHDEPALYAEPPDDPGLVGGPGSVSWELHGDLATLAVAGPAAIALEVLHPSVMAGVAEHSRYREDPLRRARSTLGYVLRTTFASAPAARREIAAVRAVHGRVTGRRPDGAAYRALDPELIAWVHTCIPWMVMTAYHRYRRPLAREEMDRYLTEQAVVGRLGGAEEVPESVDALETYVERMRGRLAMTGQTTDFLAFLAGRSAEAPAPRAEQADRRAAWLASMELAPAWARQLTGSDASERTGRLVLRPLTRLKMAAIRFACPELPCVAMARARVGHAAGSPHAGAAPPPVGR